MEIEKLKQEWKEISPEMKTEKQLIQMTKVNNHKGLKRIRLQMLIECCSIILFIVFSFTAFDGDVKSPFSMSALVLVSVMYLVVRFYIWLKLNNPIKKQNIKQSLQSFKNQLVRLALGHLFASTLFGLTIMYFFIIDLEMTKSRWVFTGGMFLTLGIVMGVLCKIWRTRIKQINNVITSF